MNEELPAQAGHSYELASVGARFVALLVDSLVLGAIGFAIGCVLSLFISADQTQLPIVLGLIINVAYNWYFWTRRDGQTPGKTALGIRIIKTDGSPISDADALLRILGYWVNGVALGLGYIWAFFDPNNQGWHDKMANTYVVVAPQDKKKVVI